MSKFSSLLLLIIALSVQNSAQLINFPNVLNTKIKGPVHTVLTIEQRLEEVFNTVVEVYDLKGKLIERSSSNASLSPHSSVMVRISSKHFYTYDADGKLIKMKIFSEQGRYWSYENYKYDEQNRLIEVRFYEVKGKELGYKKYTYFPEKKEVLVEWDNHYGKRRSKPLKVLLSYNEKEQWTKRVELEPISNDVETFEYDSNGSLVKEVNCCKFKVSHIYSYQFDKQGNWIEQQNTSVEIDENGKEKTNPEWMRKYRVITYYSENEANP